MKNLSIVIPAYNESESLETLCVRLNNAMAPMKISYEVIFVDGGSRDGSFDLLIALKERFPVLRIVEVQERCSQSLAIALGIYFSEGEIIICMDADLQNDPADIPLFLEKIKDRYDIVCGWRKKRKDPVLKIIISCLGNAVLSRLSGIALHDFSCTFKAFRKECAKKVGRKLFPGFHRFIPLIGKEFRFSICEIETAHQRRFYGKSKYSFLKIFEAFYGYFLIAFGGGLQRDFPQERLLRYVKQVVS